MTWIEIRKDHKGNLLRVKHSGEKPANVPDLIVSKSKPSKPKKVHVMPRNGEVPYYVDTRESRPSAPRTRRPENPEVSYGRAGRSDRPSFTMDSATTIPISIHPNDPVSSRGGHGRPTARPVYGEPTSPHGYGRDGARPVYGEHASPHDYGRDGARRSYNGPAPRPVSRGRDPRPRSRDVEFTHGTGPIPGRGPTIPGRGPTRYPPALSTTDFAYGNAPPRLAPPARDLTVNVTRPLSQGIDFDYGDGPVAHGPPTPRTAAHPNARARFNGVEVTPKRDSGLGYNVVEHKPRRHADEQRRHVDVPMQHSPTLRALEGSEVYDRHLSRSFRGPQYPER